MKIARKLWILALLVILVNQFNVYALYMTSAEITAAAIGSGTASLGITGNETVAYPVCNSSLTTNFGRWNYVSIPLELSDGNIVTELGSIAGKYDLVYEYDHETGDFFYYYAPFDVGTISSITGGNCYIIKATVATTTNFNGTANLNLINHSLTTSNGRWNYVGWVAEDTSLNSAFSSIDGMFDLSYTYDPETGDFFYYYAPFDVGDYDTVESCGCQLIKATVEEDFVYSIS